MYKKYDLSKKKLEQIAKFLWAKEQMSNSLKKPSNLLIYHEWPERIAHSHSFVMSDLSDSLTVDLLTWAIHSQLLICPKQSKQISDEWIPNPDAHHTAWLCGGMHTVELDSAVWCTLLDSVVCCTLPSFLRNLGHLTPQCDARRGAGLCSMMHTAKSDFAVCITLRS